MPARRDELGPFYRDVIAVDPLEPYGAASAAYRLELLARTLPFPVGDARLVPSNNNDVWRLEAGYLRVAWRGDRGRLAREAELLGRLRALHSWPLPADLAWALRRPAADPIRCAAPGLSWCCCPPPQPWS
jgi:hypothetical protein